MKTLYKVATHGMVQPLPESTNIGPNPMSAADKLHRHMRKPRIIIKKKP